MLWQFSFDDHTDRDNHDYRDDHDDHDEHDDHDDQTDHVQTDLVQKIPLPLYFSAKASLQ